MGQLRLQKRLSSGIALMFNYQYSKVMEMRSYLNNSDPKPEKRIAGEDRTHRLAFSGVFELPFGPGRPFGATAPGVVQRIIEGWSINGIYTYNTGAPLGWGNSIYYGGDLNPQPGNVDAAFDTTRFNRVSSQQLSQNIRTFPSRFGNLREAAWNNVDVSIIKDTHLTETIKLQYRAEAFNAFNHPNFNNPNTTPTSSNFGKITSQQNLPRTIQMALKVVW